MVCAVLCIGLGSAIIYYSWHYSRIIDQRLKGHLYENPPQLYDNAGTLLTNLAGDERAKRRLVEFPDIPKVLLNAVTAGEDQNFFNHHGLDVKRIAAAAIWNAQENHRLQGASTITQQLARSFFLNREPTLRRKMAEAMIAVQLELRLTKKQIFTMYANEVYLGEHGLYAMHGFGQAAKSLFGKELHDLTLPEAATLAGIIPAPNNFSPTKHPDRALARRDLILRAMRQAGSITEDEYQHAKQTKLEVLPSTTDNEAPYFVDFTRDELIKNYPEDGVMYGGYRVQTTLDMKLQRAAEDAVSKGLALAEKELAGDRKKHGEPNDESGARLQAALIALNPHNGEIKAIVGGSDYNASQFNRVNQAFRQPGSVFKPFVYAAALETGFNATYADLAQDARMIETSELTTPSIQDRVMTPLTRIMDAPRTFMYSGQTYEPNNFKGGFAGLVSLRTAIQKSLNSAAVQVAERVGYGRVAQFAHRMGLNQEIRGYPSIALGAFEVTPVELAGAYTAFANEGKRVEPHAIRSVETPDGLDVTIKKYEPHEVMRPELAYVMTNLMEGVINRGTGARVRGRGFYLPAAGKTGTSRDGWFAGYTKDLLVIAWVGFDDNRDLGLEGSRSALPIWTEFMMQAYALYPPGKNMAFQPPSGVEFVTVDSETMMRATSDCEDTYQEVFIRGTAPIAYCPIHSSPFTAASVDKVSDSSALRAKPSER